MIEYKKLSNNNLEIWITKESKLDMNTVRDGAVDYIRKQSSPLNVRNEVIVYINVCTVNDISIGVSLRSIRESDVSTSGDPAKYLFPRVMVVVIRSTIKRMYVSAPLSMIFVDSTVTKVDASYPVLATVINSEFGRRAFNMQTYVTAVYGEPSLSKILGYWGVRPAAFEPDRMIFAINLMANLVPQLKHGPADTILVRYGELFRTTLFRAKLALEQRNYRRGYAG